MIDSWDWLMIGRLHVYQLNLDIMALSLFTLAQNHLKMQDGSTRDILA